MENKEETKNTPESSCMKMDLGGRQKTCRV